MFGGLKSAADNYAGLINLYKQTFKDTMKLYCMAAPVGSDLFLPAKINKLKEREFIEYFYNKIGDNATCVLAYDEIRKHKNEYIQFNTDHHWTGLGAYYAYVAFCKAAGFSPVPLEKMTRKVIPNFLGTLYYQTRAEELKENIDSVVYHKIPYETQVTYFKTGYTNGYKGSLYAEMARGGNSYGVFLGSDYPLMRVISPNKNGRKILVFKDSYGNAFSPYLASHYQEVFIVDYRHFNANICELVRTYGITDIIFAHNVYVYNSGYTISREKELLNGFKQNSIKK